MYISPFQNSRAAFFSPLQPVNSREPQAIFLPRPAFPRPRPIYQRIPGQGPQYGQLQGSSGPKPLSLEEVLAERGFQMPERPTGAMTRDHAMHGKDPVTGKMRYGSGSLRGYYKQLDDMYAQNPEALEIAKQYNTDPTQFGGEKPVDRRQALGDTLYQTPQQPIDSQPAPEQALSDRRGVQMQEMQAMMREMMQMITQLSNRGGFGGGFGGGYSPSQQMMFGGIGSIPMSRGLYF